MTINSRWLPGHKKLSQMIFTHNHITKQSGCLLRMLRQAPMTSIHLRATAQILAFEKENEEYKQKYQ
jgi:hypothetical protein